MALCSCAPAFIGIIYVETQPQTRHAQFQDQKESSVACFTSIPLRLWNIYQNLFVNELTSLLIAGVLSIYFKQKMKGWGRSLRLFIPDGFILLSFIDHFC